MTMLSVVYSSFPRLLELRHFARFSCYASFINAEIVLKLNALLDGPLPALDPPTSSTRKKGSSLPAAQPSSFKGVPTPKSRAVHPVAKQFASLPVHKRKRDELIEQGHEDARQTLIREKDADFDLALNTTPQL